jgi:long-subunit fatty acid transport protein
MFGTIINSVNAQKHPETGIWLTLYTPVNFSSHWQWFNDFGYRTLGISASAIQYYYRTAARYNFNKQWSAAAGVAFFFTRTKFTKENHEFGHEFRFWEEVSHQQAMNKNLQLLLRLRTEQRFFAATSVKDKYTGFRFRLRPGINQKINDKWSLQLTDEYMRQIAKHEFSYDQNRLTLSGIYHFNKATQLQAGYLWLKWPKDDQHILTITFTQNISVHGK